MCSPLIKIPGQNVANGLVSSTIDSKDSYCCRGV